MDIRDLQLFLFENQLNRQKSELEKIIQYRIKGAILRSRTKWYNEGEKNTKYFLHLEKRHFKQETVSQIKTNANETVTSDKEILIECETFYKNLYASKHETRNDSDTTFFFEHENDTVLHDYEQNACEGVLTEKECLEASKTWNLEKLLELTGCQPNFIRLFGKIYRSL